MPALTVVGVEDDGNAVERGHGTDEVGCGDGAGHGSLLLLGRVGEALPGEEGGTALGGLEDDGRLGLAGGLEGGDPTRGLASKTCAPNPCGWSSTYTVELEVTLTAGIAKPLCLA